MKNIRSKTKTDILNELMRQSLKSNNETFINKGNNKEYKNKKSGIGFINNNNSDFIYHNNEINTDVLQKNKKAYEIANYSNLANSQFSNNYESVQTSIEIKLHNYDSERNNQHRKPNNQSNEALHQDDFETDVEFRDSGFKDRKLGIHGSKYLVKEKLFESSMGDNSINESTGMKSKNNVFKSKK